MARVGAAKVQKRISVLLCHHIVPLTTKLLFLILTPYLVITVVRLHYYRSLHCRTILQSHFAINRQTKRKPINLTVVSVATQCILSRANLSGSSQNNKCAPNWSQFMFTVSPLIEDNIFSSSSLSVKTRNEKIKKSVRSNFYGEKLPNRCRGVNSHVWKPVEAAGLTGSDHTMPYHTIPYHAGLTGSDQQQEVMECR